MGARELAAGVTESVTADVCAVHLKGHRDGNPDIGVRRRWIDDLFRTRPHRALLARRDGVSFWQDPFNVVAVATVFWILVFCVWGLDEEPHR